ncbi:luciferase family oxidoreductase group 1 [Paenibacillus shirakamiensis]|uniref:Luciferase family oxidoreductase group 1 n=1 Tax=Paenibacillus shirakamiensis TaxID=1265935 RepID=A0ABS4JGQ5_9BACL|nr:MsnO8 family LLM class oxidoreductase [Paenibacillus shirakamiensis]MBP2000900.1 luciferase family oxidoreductase group 1 [Paenibacillus shirakamiensis]
MNGILLSVLDLVPRYEEVSPSKALYKAVELAERAEEYGYHRYWVAEHHDMENLCSPSPEILLSHIGAKTRSIRLGSGALLLPHYSPLKVVETYHMLSCLYPNRMDLGIGRAPGGSAHAAMALSGNFLQEVENLPNKIKDVLDLLHNQYNYDETQVIARPLPSYRPELWLLGTNKKSADYAADFGTGYVFGHFMSEDNGLEVIQGYRTRFSLVNSLITASQVIVAVSVIIGNTEDEAWGWASSAQHHFKGRSIVGTQNQVIQVLIDLQKEYQNEEFIIVCPIPSYEERILTYERLAKGWADAEQNNIKGVQ